MKIKYLFFIVICLAVGCTRTENRTLSQGGQDSGGGNTVFSTEAEVQAAYERAFKDFPSILDSMTIDYFIDRIVNLEQKYLLKAFDNKLFSLLSKQELKDIEDNNAKLEKGGDAIFLESDKIIPMYAGLKKVMDSSQIKINKDEPCSALNNPHAYGSIKEFKIGSPICISFYKFKTIPPDNLYKEILGVLLHEYAHALNFDERSAILLQRLLTNNMVAIDRITKARVFTKDEQDDIPINLAITTDKLKKSISNIGPIEKDNRIEFCDLLNEASFKSRLLYDKYDKIIDDNSKQWIERKLIGKKAAFELSHVFFMFTRFLLNENTDTAPLFKKCQSSDEQIVIDFKTQYALSRFTEYVYRMVSASSQIDYYQSRLY